MVADLGITRQLTRGATMVLLIIFAFLGCYQNLQENFWALCLWVKLKSLTEQFTRGSVPGLVPETYVTFHVA